MAAVQRLEEKYLDEMFDSFLVKVTDDTHLRNVPHYMNGLLEVRDYALRDIQQRFAEVAQMNREIAGETGDAIKKLAYIKFGATAILIGTSCGLTLAGSAVALHVGVVKLGYDALGASIKGWNEADSTQAIAIGIGKEVVKFGAEEESHEKAKHVLKASEAWMEGNKEKLKAATAKVDHYAAKLAQKVNSRKSLRGFQRAVNKQAKLSGNLARGARTMQAARVARVGIPVVFAGLALIDALHELHEDTDAAD